MSDPLDAPYCPSTTGDGTAPLTSSLLSTHIMEAIAGWARGRGGRLSQNDVLDALAVAAAWYITETPTPDAQINAVIRMSCVNSGAMKRFNEEKYPDGPTPPAKQ